MRTLLEILNATTDFFKGKGLDKPRLQTELLLAAVLGCRRLDLYLQFERPLPEEILEKMRGWVRRRVAREPLQYITGETAFRDLTLKCDPRALIPRPETEELAGFVLEEIAKRGATADVNTDATTATAETATANETAPESEVAVEPPPEIAPPPAPEVVLEVADLGTGTGAIALSLASENPALQVTASDISAAALALAAENAAKLPPEVAARVRFAQSDWLQNIEGAFDVIVSNPPYLTEAELATAEPEVARHEPRNALVAADNGLAALKTILEQARGRLRTGGFVGLETGIAHADALAVFAAALGYVRHEARRDMSGRDRFFFAWV
jgi:release factor glutamine methyltransferase